MKKLKLIIVCLLVTVGAFAQNSDMPNPKRIHEIGAHLGATTGMGLSYRYWPTKVGVQVTMLPIKTSNETMLNLGVTGLYSIYNSRLIRFFGYFGNNIVYEKYKNDDSSYSSYSGYGSYSGYSSSTKSTKYNIGFGPGLSFGTRVRVNIMAGYGLYDVFNEFNVLPTGEIGLYFCL
jgi:hypothetical protein